LKSKKTANLTLSFYRDIYENKVTGKNEKNRKSGKKGCFGLVFVILICADLPISHGSADDSQGPAGCSTDSC
jgi:hypothetical protein